MTGQRVTDLQRRMIVTLGALTAFVLGRDIPIIGLDPQIFGMDFAKDGFPHRLSLFALGITPFLSSWALCQFACLVAPSLARWRQALPANHRRLAEIARGLGLAFACLQGFGVAVALENVTGAVAQPGWVFVIETTATLAAGALVVPWLSDVITARGLGDGFVVLLAAPILAQSAALIPLLPQLLRVGATSLGALMLAGLFTAACVGVLAFASALRPPRRPADTLGGLASLDIWPIILAGLVAALGSNAGRAFARSDSVGGTNLHAVLFVAALAFFTFRRASTTPGEPPGRVSPRWASAVAQAAVFVALSLVGANADFPFALNLEGLTFVVVACAGVALSARTSLGAPPPSR